jgi:ribonuclease HII
MSLDSCSVILLFVVGLVVLAKALQLPPIPFEFVHVYDKRKFVATCPGRLTMVSTAHETQCEAFTRKIRNGKVTKKPGGTSPRGHNHRRSQRVAALTSNAAALATIDTNDDITNDDKPHGSMMPRGVSRKRKIHSKLATTSLTNDDSSNEIKKRRRKNQSSPNKKLSNNEQDDNCKDEPIAMPNNYKTNTSRGGKRCKASTLPRTLEESIRRSHPNVDFVLGIDEAGRGPLAGPVVVGGVRMISSSTVVHGVVDSKQITLESQRELLYQQLMDSFELENSAATKKQGTRGDDNCTTSTVNWAIAVIDAATIDDINILQATMLGMRLVASVITGQSIPYPIVDSKAMNGTYPTNGCYVISLNSVSTQQQSNTDKIDVDARGTAEVCDDLNSTFYALVDGNRVPTEMPCPADAIVKGDSREYCIAAASILAKVTRDRIMHQYHESYPVYNFAQHKGYPTTAHVQAIRTHGPSPIHRLSFAPLKMKTTSTNSTKPKR